MAFYRESGKKFMAGILKGVIGGTKTIIHVI